MAKRITGCLALMQLLGSVAGCTENDTTRFGVVDNGGTAGSTTGSGGSSPGGGSGGQVAGAGGMDDGGTDAGTARFHAVLQGNVVNLQALDDAWVRHCDDRSVEVVQRSGETWTPLRDDRPPALNRQHAAHYLDDTYHEACRLSLGCDYDYCGAFRDIDWDNSWDSWNMSAREYVQVGERDAPICDPLDAGARQDAAVDAGVQRVPALESRAAQGALAVRIRYYSTSTCNTPALTALVDVE